MSQRRPPRRGTPPTETSWERVATWYDGWVGDQGSAYYQQVAIPAVMDLLDPQPGERIPGHRWRAGGAGRAPAG